MIAGSISQIAGQDENPPPEQTVPAESSLAPEDGYYELSLPGERYAWTVRFGAALVLALLLVALVMGNVYLEDSRELAVEIAAAFMAVGLGFILIGYPHRRLVDMERAYSKHLETMSRNLRRLAYRDALTKLYNHRYFREQLGAEVDRSQRYGGSVSVLMIDIDGFKGVNDRYGHLMGDTMLAYVAELIAQAVRSSDVAARYGGDEFAVILPETNREAAATVAQKLGGLIGGAPHWQGALLQGMGVGVSVGTATFPDDGRTADELLVAADAALYSLKRQRRAPAAESATGQAAHDVA